MGVRERLKKINQDGVPTTILAWLVVVVASEVIKKGLGYGMFQFGIGFWWCYFSVKKGWLS